MGLNVVHRCPFHTVSSSSPFKRQLLLSPPTLLSLVLTLLIPYLRMYAPRVWDDSPSLLDHFVDRFTRQFHHPSYATFTPSNFIVEEYTPWRPVSPPPLSPFWNPPLLIESKPCLNGSSWIVCFTPSFLTPPTTWSLIYYSRSVCLVLGNDPIIRSRPLARFCIQPPVRLCPWCRFNCSALKSTHHISLETNHNRYPWPRVQKILNYYYIRKIFGSLPSTDCIVSTIGDGLRLWFVSGVFVHCHNFMGLRNVEPWSSGGNYIPYLSHVLTRRSSTPNRLSLHHVLRWCTLASWTTRFYQLFVGWSQLSQASIINASHLSTIQTTCLF